MTENTNEQRNTKLDRLAQNYNPSWYDRFSNWVDKSRLPNWLIYLLSPAFLILLGMLAQKLDGSGTLRDWEPISFVAISQSGYLPRRA